jgi:hypothetical protein
MKVDLTAEQRRYQVSSFRICAQTFVFEKDLPKGQKLLMCSKCKETFYRDRDSQLKHWPKHKKLCCAIEKDDTRVRDGTGFDNVIDCCGVIHALLKNPMKQIRGRLLLYAFQQLMAYGNSKAMMAPHFDDSDPEYEEFTVTTFQQVFDYITVRLQGAIDISASGKEVAELLWSIPGFVCFFLSEEIFLSPTMKQWKLEGNLPPPKDKYYRDGTLQPLSRKKSSYQLHAGSTSLIFILMEKTVLAMGTSVTQIYADGGLRNLNLQSTAFGAAMERRLLESWLCPYARASFPLESMGNAKGKRSEKFSGALAGHFRSTNDASGTHYDETKEAISSRLWKKPDEIMSGVTIKQALCNIIDDEHLIQQCNLGHLLLFLHALDADYDASNPTEAPWKHFTFQDRIDVLDFYHRQDNVIKYCVLFDGSTICFQEYWCSVVLGLSSKTVFKVYETLVDPSGPGASSPKTIQYIKEKRDSLLAQPRRLVQIYLNVVEPKYLRRQELAKEQALPFPNELLDHIASYLAKASVDCADISCILQMGQRKRTVTHTIQRERPLSL